MTDGWVALTEHSVVALVCAECEVDLRGAPKVLDGARYLCPTCSWRLEYQREHGQPRERSGVSA